MFTGVGPKNVEAILPPHVGVIDEPVQVAFRLDESWSLQAQGVVQHVRLHEYGHLCVIDFVGLQTAQTVELGRRLAGLHYRLEVARQNETAANEVDKPDPVQAGIIRRTQEKEKHREKQEESFDLAPVVMKPKPKVAARPKSTVPSPFGLKRTSQPYSMEGNAAVQRTHDEDEVEIDLDEDESEHELLLMDL